MAQLPIAIKATAEQERLERQATEDLAAALQKWAVALLRNVNSFNLNTMLDRLNNPRWAGNIAMRDALIAIMQRAAEVGVDAGVEALYSGNATKAQPVIDVGGVDWELVNVDAAEWALNYSHLLMNDISSTTRRAIQREIAYYVENSMTINQLRDRIMSLSTFSETRANRIAVTETTRAYAEGNMRAWSDLDYVERVRWQTANDDLVCPICGPLNQQTVAKGELFAGRYYSPPAHVNCRCGVSPVVTGAEDAGAGGAPGLPGGAAADRVYIPKFIDAREAEAWLLENGYAQQANLKGLDDAALQAVTESVVEHMTRYPKIKEVLKIIDANPDTPRGVLGQWWQHRGVLELNPALLSDSEELVRLLSEAKSSNWISAATRKSIIDHEMAHVIDTAYGISDKSDMKLLYERARQMAGGISGNLSEYAASNIGEMVAEGWAEYLTGNSRPLAVEIGNLINTIARR